MSWLRQCADWLAHLDADSYPPAVNLRPSADWPDRAVVAVDLARVAAVIDRIAADVDELARARRVQDLTTAAVLPDPRAERRRRLAEPDLEFRAFCTRRRLPASSTRNWSAPGTPVSGRRSCCERLAALTKRGSQKGSQRHRHQATPGHFQPQSWLADATSGHVQPRRATVWPRLTSEGSLVRSQLRPLFSQLKAVLRS